MSLIKVVIISLLVSISNFTWAVSEDNNKLLIIYYSKSGNTQAIADMIQKKTGGDIYEIKTKRSYPRERPEAADIPKEEYDTGNFPELEGTLPNLATYQTIIIGSPIWWYTVSTPVISYLMQVDFEGKRVAGFYTYAGDAHKFNDDITRFAKHATLLDSIGFRGTYDTGRGKEPDGNAYQQEHKEDINEELDAWLHNNRIPLVNN